MGERFELVLTGREQEDVSGNTDVKEQVVEEKPTEEIVAKTSPKVGQNIAKGIGTVTMLYGVTSNIIAQTERANLSIRGDAVAQRRLDNTMAYVNESVGFLGSIAIGGAIGGVPGMVVAGVAQATKWALQGIQLSIENRAYIERVRMENSLNMERQRRYVQDITGVRI